MQNFIFQIRKQPERVKRSILHVTTGIFAVLLVMLWVYSLGTNLSSDDTQAKINQDLKPLSALKANILDGYNVLSNPTPSDVQQ
jgi:hypothetical protein